MRLWHWVAWTPRALWLCCCGGDVRAGGLRSPPGLRSLACSAPAKGTHLGCCASGHGPRCAGLPEQGHIARLTGATASCIGTSYARAACRCRLPPAQLVAQPDGPGWVAFDQAEHHIFRIALDGNVSKGIVLLGLPDAAAGSIAPTRLGSLSVMADGSLCLLATERSQLAHFDAAGKLQATSTLDLKLPYPNPMYVRAQAATPGVIYVQDHHQGRVLSNAARTSSTGGCGSPRMGLSRRSPWCRISRWMSTATSWRSPRVVPGAAAEPRGGRLSRCSRSC